MTMADVARSTYLRTHSESDHLRRELVTFWLNDAAAGASLVAFVAALYCLI
jgi:hypothetical protein